MKVILLQEKDQPYDWQLEDTEVVNFYLTNSLEDDIGKIYDHNPDCIIIPLDLKHFYDDVMQSVIGGELLVWLRIKGINHPIFALGNLTIENYLGYNFSLFLGANDVEFCSKLSNQQEIMRFISNHHKQNPKKFLSPYINVSKLRHSYANIWGLSRLVEAHNECLKEKINLTINEYSFGLEYNAFQYYFDQDFKVTENLKNEIRNNYRQLKSYKNFSVAYIDDQADTGWYVFLKSLFHASVNLVKIKVNEKTTEETLYVELKDYQKKLKNLKFIISDLRLLKKEANMRDYVEFISMKAMKKVYNDHSFDKVNYLLFTASNQLLNFKNAFKKREFTPTDFFIKEGFDIQNGPLHKYQNFNNLLVSLSTLSKYAAEKSYKSRGEETITGNIEHTEIEAAELFLNKLRKGHYVNDAALLNAKFIPYTHIILDTNIFLVDEPFFPFYSDTKVVITYPVFKELERMGKSRKIDKSTVFIKEFFSNFDINKVSKVGLTSEDIKIINIKTNKNENEIADGYFRKIVNAYQIMPESKILFITNDKIAKDGKESPTSTIRNWIIKNKIKNVDIGCFPNYDFKFVWQNEPINYKAQLKSVKHDKIEVSNEESKDDNNTTNTKTNKSWLDKIIKLFKKT